MRYLVRARLKPGQEQPLWDAIVTETLGAGSVAGKEYIRNMKAARLCDDGTTRWIEVCYCDIPLEEELPYWEQYFEIEKIQDAHARQNCRDDNGTDPWACGSCDCTHKLQAAMQLWGRPFLDTTNQMGCEN
jgi:hypothetical protein